MKTITTLTLLFVTITLSGCGNAVQVSGKVQYPDGEPLPLGVAAFESEKFTFSGKIHEDGTFSAGQTKDGQGIFPGTYKVFIAGALTLEAKAGGGIPDRIHWVSRRFRSKETSGLEYEITKDTKDIVITVEKPEENERVEKSAR